MRGIKSMVTVALIITVSFFFSLATANADKTVEIQLSLSKSVADHALTGRVYVLFDNNVYARPLDGPDGSPNKPFFALDVKGWETFQKLVVTNEALGFPCSLDQLPNGYYSVQALLDTNTVDRDFEDSPGVIPGGIYSEIAVVSIQDGKKNTVALDLMNKTGAREFEETELIKEIKLESRLLSDFYGRPTSIKAAVILPPSYFEDTAKKYATVYIMPGFGTRYYAAASDNFQIQRYGMNRVGLEKIFIFLDQVSSLGCHVFANSENNGPWGTAFVDELIPYIESNYRVFPDPKTRFLTGQSSGAWAGLWLQLNYPEQFGGVWAASPDPVDFTSFVGANLYEQGANLFYTRAGDTLEMIKLFADFDRVVGTGWQMGSFEAVFSTRGADGLPRRLWDRTTGNIDPAVAQSWKKYDLRLFLEANWATLAPRLAGKIHIYVADDDRFELDNPVRSLQEAMTAINADLDINILPEGGHNIWSRDLRTTIHQQMDEIIATNHPEAAPVKK